MPAGRPLTATGEAKLRKEQALARLRELQSAALEGKLLNTAEVLSTWAAAMAGVRDRALGMADRIVSRGAGRPAEELRAIVDGEVHDLLEVLSRGEL